MLVGVLERVAMVFDIATTAKEAKVSDDKKIVEG